MTPTRGIGTGETNPRRAGTTTRAPQGSGAEQRQRRSFGKIRRLRSGRYQASYVGPDGVRHYAAETYSARADAEGWLSDERRMVEWDEWIAPAIRRVEAEAELKMEQDRADPPMTQTGLTLGAYAQTWIEGRVTSNGAPLHPRTRAEYLGYLDGILSSLASRPLVQITSADVARWHGAHASTPALRHKAYSFMNSVFRTAVEVDELIGRNPCRVHNASRKPKMQSNPDRVVRTLTHETVRELADLVQPRDKMLILLLAYCCVRTGEACALRRHDVRVGTDADGLPFGWLTVERGISSYDGQRHEGETKTGSKGERIIPIPPHIVGDLAAHLAEWALRGPNGLLFPSTNPAMDFRTTQQINGHAAVLRKDGSVRKKGYGWYHARKVVEMPTLRLHWLRHWSNTVWDEAGTPEGVRRAIMGHVQQGMTGHYTHPDTTKASPYARRVSELAGWIGPEHANTATNTAPDGALKSLLFAMDPRTLAVALSTMSSAEVADLLPHLPPERVAAILAARANHPSQR